MIPQILINTTNTIVTPNDIETAKGMCNYMCSLYFTATNIFNIPYTAQYRCSTFCPHPP